MDSVSIDGRTDYTKGEMFKQDVPIIITYHNAELLEQSGLRIAPSNTRFPDFLLKTVLHECQGSNKG